MRVRILVLSALVLTAGLVVGLAGPPVLVPAVGSPISVVAGANNVAIGDVNNDGRSDLIVTSGQNRRVTVLLGRGDGRFVPSPAGALDVAESPSEVALGDVNRDQNLDVALASHDSYNVTLLIGDGRGSFRPAPGSPIAMKEGRQPPHTVLVWPTSIATDGRISSR